MNVSGFILDLAKITRILQNFSVSRKNNGKEKQCENQMWMTWMYWIFRIGILYHIYILRCIVLQPQSRAVLLFAILQKCRFWQILHIPTKQVEKYFRNIRSLLKGASKWLNHIKGAYTRIYLFYAPGKCVFRNSLSGFAILTLIHVQQQVTPW